MRRCRSRRRARRRSSADADGQASNRRDDLLAELLRPVEAAARQKLHAACLDPRLQAIAVEFDFVQPALARWAAWTTSVANVGSTKVGKGGLLRALEL